MMRSDCERNSDQARINRLLEDVAGDLGEWAGLEKLVAAVLKAVDAVWPEETSREPRSPAPSEPEPFPPSTMAALLTYFYARAVYESHEIEARLARHAVRHPFVPAPWPDAYAIQRFRRANIEKLRLGLTNVLTELCALNGCVIPADKAVPRTGISIPCRRGEPQLLAAAQERLLAAMQADSMAQDE